jgi:hypothetical protein
MPLTALSFAGTQDEVGIEPHLLPLTGVAASRSPCRATFHLVTG